MFTPSALFLPVFPPMFSRLFLVMITVAADQAAYINLAKKLSFD